jgi:hypothetical protein
LTAAAFANQRPPARRADRAVAIRPDGRVVARTVACGGGGTARALDALDSFPIAIVDWGDRYDRLIQAILKYVPFKRE